MSIGTILANGIGGRSDLPVPLWLAQYGAAAALVVSFAVLSLFWRTPRLEGQAAGGGRPLPAALQRFADAPATRIGLRLLGLLLAGVTVVWPPWVPTAAPTPARPGCTWFWVGLVPASLLLGPIWRLLNPLRTLSAGLARLAGDPAQQHARPLPPRLGYWPAAVALAAFAWLELVYPYRDEPFTLLASPTASTLLGTAGLLGTIAVVAATYSTAVQASQRYRRPSPPDGPNDRLDRLFVHSLIPILIGYTIAHYFSLLVFQGQAGYILASDPLAAGWDLFGTADWKMNLLLVSTSAIALIQVGAIVTGHILGVVTAHDRAVAVFRVRDLLRGQYPLLATMVFYTLAGIALLVGT